MPARAEPDDPQAAATYRLELHVRLTHQDRAWNVSLEGFTPEGRRLERREFASLIDLMRFLEALVQARGLR